MTTFSTVDNKARPPARIVTLAPWAFADAWQGKPTAPVAMGLRLLSDTEKTTARGEARRIASEIFEGEGPDDEDWLETRNDALMRQIAARGMCDPNNVHKPHPLFQMAEDDVQTQLSSRGARHLFEEIHRFEVETSSLNPPADDEEIEELILALRDGALTLLPTTDQDEARRLLRYVLDELRSLPAYQ